MLFWLLSFACSTAPEVHRIATQKATELEFREYHDAENGLQKSKTHSAKKNLRRSYKNILTLDLTDRACYYAGQLYYDQADYFRASKFWPFLYY